MKIPKKLKIGGHMIRVKFSDDIEDCGLSVLEKNLITINQNLPQTQIESTLIHEIFHFLNTTLSHDLQSSLSEQLYQVLSDNKLLK